MHDSSKKNPSDGAKVHQHHGEGDVNRVNEFLFSTIKLCFLFVYKLKDST